jgi:DNA repair ATPase RecN
MNDKDFALYKEVVLALLKGINVAEGKTGYAYSLVVDRLEELAGDVFNLLKRARDQQPDEEEQ